MDGRQTLGQLVAATELSLEQTYAEMTALVDAGLVAVSLAGDGENPLHATDGGGQVPGASQEPPVAQRPPTGDELREIAQFIRSTAD